MSSSAAPGSTAEPVFVSLNLISSYGACLIAVFFAFALWGVNCMQSFLFFTSSRSEHWATKFLVAWLWSLETIRVGLISRGIMTPLVLQWGNMGQLPYVIPEWTWQNLLFGFITVPAQGFFMFRIWVVLGRKWYLAVPMIGVLVWQFVGVLVYLGLTANIKTNAGVVASKSVTNIIYAVLGTGLVVDVAITIAMMCVLLSRRTGFVETDRLIVRLVVFTVNTGLWTSLLSLAIMITIAVAPDGLVYLALDFLTSGFYVTSVLANLNGRSWVRQGSSSGGPPIWTSGHNSMRMNAVQTPAPTNSTIHVSRGVFSHTDDTFTGEASQDKDKSEFNSYSDPITSSV